MQVAKVSGCPTYFLLVRTRISLSRGNCRSSIGFGKAGDSTRTRPIALPSTSATQHGGRLSRTVLRFTTGRLERSRWYLEGFKPAQLGCDQVILSEQLTVTPYHCLWGASQKWRAHPRFLGLKGSPKETNFLGDDHFEKPPHAVCSLSCRGFLGRGTSLNRPQNSD